MTDRAIDDPVVLAQIATIMRRARDRRLAQQDPQEPEEKEGAQ